MIKVQSFPPVIWNKEGEPDGYTTQAALARAFRTWWPDLVYIEVSYKGRRATGYFRTEKEGVLERRLIPMREFRPRLKYVLAEGLLGLEGVKEVG